MVTQRARWVRCRARAHVWSERGRSLAVLWRHPERVMSASTRAGYRRLMLLRPLRRAPMMLGGVGFQVGLDDARRKRMQAQRQATGGAPVVVSGPDVVTQLTGLKALLDDGVLTPEEFRMAKAKVL